jgi:hypothetical protein
MIQKFTELRVLATLRRIAKAMEEANRLEKYRQAIEYPPLAKTEPPPIRKVVITHPTVEQWNQDKRGKR